MTTIARSFTPEETKRYAKNKLIVNTYNQSVKLWTEALYEIRVKQDYLQDHMTWEKWCEINIPWRPVKSIDRMLRTEATKLAEKVATTEVEATTEPAPEGDLRDDTGFIVPEHLHDIWKRRKELNTLKNEISGLRRVIEKGWEAMDPLAMKLDQSIVDDLKAAYHCVAKAQLYCVCGTCNGWFSRVSDGVCQSCNSTGFMSKEQHDRLLPEQVKAIRERAAKLQK